MHEYSIAYDIYTTARRAALDNGAKEINVSPWTSARWRW